MSRYKTFLFILLISLPQAHVISKLTFNEVKPTSPSPKIPPSLLMKKTWFKTSCTTFRTQCNKQGMQIKTRRKMMRQTNTIFNIFCIHTASLTKRPPNISNPSSTSNFLTQFCKSWMLLCIEFEWSDKFIQHMPLESWHLWPWTNRSLY